MKCNIEIESKFNVDAIIKIKNDNNDKFITLKILNITLICGTELIGTFNTKDSNMQNYAEIKPTGQFLPYMFLYNCYTIDQSWYDNETAQKIINHFHIPYYEDELLYRIIK